MVFNIKKNFFRLIGGVGLFFFFSYYAFSLAQESFSVTLYFFYGDSCPHCAKEEIFLKKLQEKYPSLEIKRFEVWYNSDNRKLLTRAAEILNAQVSGVPFTVIGNWFKVGYLDDETTGKEIEEQIKNCLKVSCPDSLKLLNQNEGKKDKKVDLVLPSSLPEKISLPFLGEIKTKDLSLPFLTAVFGLADGFNPCAMWTLIFLIGLLLEMKDKKRMFLLGSAFILASGVVYFIFMAAWLNLFLFLGLIFWVRVLIGLVAVGGGVWSLKDFFTKPQAVCSTADSERKKTTFEKLKLAVRKESFWLALGGIILLAASVNLVELMCSAGLPAVYTQILSLNRLPLLSYYGYLLLYILFYMLDDMIVFGGAVLTFQLSGLSSKYSRWSRLVGGIILLILGMLLIFKPEWLMF